LTELQDFKTVCERAAMAAGAVLLDWAGRFEVREKGPSDLVTEADLASQETIQKTILNAFPRHGFLAEENLSIPSSDRGLRWIVDPLDGTTNYVHGIPAFAVSIALEQDGEPLVGTVYDPVSRECYSAIKGEGAWLNGRKLRSSKVATLSRAVIAMSFPANIQHDAPELADFMKVITRVQAMRRMGSSALNLCYVAAGRYDAFWSRSTKPWDIAAGMLLVREAGGVMTDLVGGPVQLELAKFIATSTPELHRELVTLLGKP
jgi:myo-inositol-1(or 4)-monophosphatase